MFGRLGRGAATLYRGGGVIHPSFKCHSFSRRVPRASFSLFSSFHHTTTTRSSSTNVSTPPRPRICIWWGSQGGTARLLGMQLQDALESDTSHTVTLQGLHEVAPDQILCDDAQHVFVISTAGVGEPPDNAKAFYDWLLQQSPPPPASNEHETATFKNVRYTVFGLGNARAHPHHYNVMAKSLHQKLQELGACSYFKLGLGDDGDCLEEDFDVWMEDLVKTTTLLQRQETRVEPLPGQSLADAGGQSPAVEPAIRDETRMQQAQLSPSDTSHTPSHSTRRISTKFPPLTLLPPDADVVRDHLMEVEHFYPSDVQLLSVKQQQLLSGTSGEYGLRQVTLELSPPQTYQAGDHVVVVPRNSDCVVQAFCDLLDVPPHTQIIASPASTTTRPYPHPTGVTVMETLSHCVDLGATPSPAFCRLLLQQPHLNYKEDIVQDRRTILDLALESKVSLSLEEWLYHLPPMQPRYYSIASSPLAHPSQVLITYRPVKYMTARGMVREGVCTSFLSHLGPPAVVPAAVRSNPNFRLPSVPEAPTLWIAGGCGIAPIHAFLQERLYQHDSQGTVFGPSHLFLGFRSPADQVYQDLVREALDKGVLSRAHVSYTGGCTTPEQNCRLVSDTVQSNGKLVWELFQNGGYAYLCGGARAFGTAIEKEMILVFQKEGQLTFDEATHYLQTLIKEGRFCEDLAD